MNEVQRLLVARAVGGARRGALPAVAFFALAFGIDALLAPHVLHAFAVSDPTLTPGIGAIRAAVRAMAVDRGRVSGGCRVPVIAKSRPAGLAVGGLSIALRIRRSGCIVGALALSAVHLWVEC